MEHKQKWSVPLQIYHLHYDHEWSFLSVFLPVPGQHWSLCVEDFKTTITVDPEERKYVILI